MKTATAPIRSLIDRVDRGELRLPEIQRGYVWKPAQVAGLIDSLYRKYPSGSLLLWETDLEVRERAAAISGPNASPIVKPQYLLDGQQRLTSLHRVFTGHPNALVVFEVENERFQIESAATRKDTRWIRVHTLLAAGDDDDDDDPEDALVIKLPHVGRRAIRSRLNRVRAIADYVYYLEILEGLPYEEVTQIFVRVNSRGRPLKATDLALATLSARWEGVISKFEAEAETCAQEGYGALDFTFLTRCLAALVSESSSASVFATAPEVDLVTGWQRLQFGLRHLIKLLKGHADISTSTLIPSVNALIPLVVYLGLRKDERLESDERDALLYWLFGAWIQARFSGSSATIIAQDVAAVRSESPIQSLYRNLGLLGQRLAVTDQMLAGRGVASPFFLLSYLVARRRAASDWWYGIPVSTSDDGAYRVEYHHIHPRATLSATYSKTEINDLANLAFISGKANRKISARSPEAYFPEVGDAELERHFVPLDPALRVASAFPLFVRARRTKLAEAMTDLLDSFRPSFVDSDEEVLAREHQGETLSFSVYATDENVEEALMTVTARCLGQPAWTTTLPLQALRGALEDLRDGRGTGLEIGGEEVNIDADAEALTLPMGPFLVTGSIEEWESVLDRELAEMQPPGDRPTFGAAILYEGDRLPFSVLESD